MASKASPAGSALVGSGAGGLLAPDSTQGKVETVARALALRDEQIQAKIIYFGADQETNKELDAITEGVIAELIALQAASAKAASASDQTGVEIELINNLRGFLEKLFSPRREGFLRRKIEDIQRRITTLFFNSTLYTKLSATNSAAKTMTWPDQAVFVVLKTHEATLLDDLKTLPYANPGVLEEAIERYHRIEKGLRMEYLSRTTPELERLLAVYREELQRFFENDFRATMGEFCWEVIRESRVAAGKPFGYKLGADAFQSFRGAFDKHFLEKLVLNVQEPILAKAKDLKETFRDETLAFVADPHIFSEVCAVVCDSIYDYLHGEGFLELPPRWRAHLYRQPNT